MPMKKRSTHTKKKSAAKRGKIKKAKRAPSLKKKALRKSAKTSSSKTSGSSSISTVTKKKKKWIPMAITRIQLDPSQAVLSCCDQAMRSQQGASQCQDDDCNSPGSTGAMNQSS